MVVVKMPISSEGQCSLAFTQMAEMSAYLAHWLLLPMLHPAVFEKLSGWNVADLKKLLASKASFSGAIRNYPHIFNIVDLAYDVLIPPIVAFSFP